MKMNLFKLIAPILILALISCEPEDDTTNNATDPNTTTNDLQAVDDMVNVEHNTSKEITPLSNDNGVDISILGVSSNPSNGTVSVNGNIITYTPNQGYTGQDSFDYEISDLTNNTDIGTVTVNVLPNNVNIGDSTTVDTNNVPVIQASVELRESTEWKTANSFITDSDGDNITLISMTGASHGEVIVSSNSIRYEPSGLWWGNDTVTATFTDGNDTVSASIVIIFGTDGQRLTWELLEPFLNVQFEVNSDLPNLRIDADGTLTSNSSLNFYSTFTPGANWTINGNGHFEIYGMTNPQMERIAYSLRTDTESFNGDTWVYLYFDGMNGHNWDTRAWYIQ